MRDCGFEKKLRFFPPFSLAAPADHHLSYNIYRFSNAESKQNLICQSAGKGRSAMKITPRKLRQLLVAMEDYVATNRCSVVSDCIQYIQQGHVKYALSCLQHESDKIEHPLRRTMEKLHVLIDWGWFARYKKYRRRAGLE